MTQISEVMDIDPETDRCGVIDIFNFRDGASLQPTGYLPSFVDELVEKRLLEVEFLYGRDYEPPLLGPPGANGAAAIAGEANPALGRHAPQQRLPGKPAG